MRAVRSTKYTWTFDSEDVVAALKARYPRDFVMLLPDDPAKASGRLEAKLVGALGLEITYHLPLKTQAQVEHQNARQQGEELDPA